jgi:hypothetical protein
VHSSTLDVYTCICYRYPGHGFPVIHGSGYFLGFYASVSTEVDYRREPGVSALATAVVTICRMAHIRMAEHMLLHVASAIRLKKPHGNLTATTRKPKYPVHACGMPYVTRSFPSQWRVNRTVNCNDTGISHTCDDQRLDFRGVTVNCSCVHDPFIDFANNAVGISSILSSSWLQQDAVWESFTLHLRYKSTSEKSVQPEELGKDRSCCLSLGYHLRGKAY